MIFFQYCGPDPIIIPWNTDALQPFCKGNVILIGYYGNIFSHSTFIVTPILPITDINTFHNMMKNASLDDLKYVVNILKTYLKFSSHSGFLKITEFISMKNELKFSQLTGIYPDLHIASQIGNIEVVKFLMESGKANPNDIRRFQKDELWMTPLHLACKFGKTDVVKEFMKHQNVYFESQVCVDHFLDPGQCLGNKINSTDFGLTALHIACKYGNVDIVELLLTKVDINIAASLGRTPLQVACYAGKTKVVELLLNYAAIYYLHLIVNQTPLEERDKEWNLRFEKRMENWISNLVL